VKTCLFLTTQNENIKVVDLKENSGKTYKGSNDAKTINRRRRVTERTEIEKEHKMMRCQAAVPPPSCSSSWQQAECWLSFSHEANSFFLAFYVSFCFAYSPQELCTTRLLVRVALLDQPHSPFFIGLKKTAGFSKAFGP